MIILKSKKEFDKIFKLIKKDEIEIFGEIEIYEDKKNKNQIILKKRIVKENNLKEKIKKIENRFKLNDKNFIELMGIYYYKKNNKITFYEIIKFDFIFLSKIKNNLNNEDISLLFKDIINALFYLEKEKIEIGNLNINNFGFNQTKNKYILIYDHNINKINWNNFKKNLNEIQNNNCFISPEVYNSLLNNSEFIQLNSDTFSFFLNIFNIYFNKLENLYETENFNWNQLYDYLKNFSTNYKINNKIFCKKIIKSIKNIIVKDINKRWSLKDVNEFLNKTDNSSKSSSSSSSNSDSKSIKISKKSSKDNSSSIKKSNSSLESSNNSIWSENKENKSTQYVPKKFNKIKNVKNILYIKHTNEENNIIEYDFLPNLKDEEKQPIITKNNERIYICEGSNLTDDLGYIQLPNNKSKSIVKNVYYNYK